jgi:SAM-dependent methyltransferase
MSDSELYDNFGAIYAAAFDWNVADQVAPISALSGIERGRVIEPMCGSARLLGAFAMAGFDTVGIDRSATMLALAQAYYDRLGLTGEWLQTDATSFNLDQACDLAICPGNSLAHLPSEAMMIEHLNCMSRNLISGASYWLQLDLKQPSRVGQVEDWQFEYLDETLTCEWAVTGAHNGFETHVTRFVFPDGRLIDATYDMKQWSFVDWQRLLTQTPFDLSSAYRTDALTPVAIGQSLDDEPLFWQQLTKLH